MIFVAVLAAALSSGCAWLGSGDDSQTTTMTAQENAQPQTADGKTDAQSAAGSAPTEQKTAKSSKNAKKNSKKSAKTEAQIKAELDAMGRKLAAQSARTLLPNKSKKDVKKVGSSWIASYIDVDSNNVSTEMRPGSNGQYVGFIRYQERFMECKGNSKEAALKSADCQQVKTRNLNELIRYDGTSWQD